MEVMNASRPGQGPATPQAMESSLEHGSMGSNWSSPMPSRYPEGNNSVKAILKVSIFGPLQTTLSQKSTHIIIRARDLRPSHGLLENVKRGS